MGRRKRVHGEQSKRLFPIISISRFYKEDKPIIWCIGIAFLPVVRLLQLAPQITSAVLVGSVIGLVIAILSEN